MSDEIQIPPEEDQGPIIAPGLIAKAVRDMFQNDTEYAGSTVAAIGDDGASIFSSPDEPDPFTPPLDSGYPWIGDAESDDNSGYDVAIGSPSTVPGNVEAAPQAIENLAVCVSGQQSTLDLAINENGDYAYLNFGSAGDSNSGVDYSTGPCISIEADNTAVNVILTPESGNGAVVTIDANASVFNSNSVTAVDFFVYDPRTGGRAILLGAMI